MLTKLSNMDWFAVKLGYQSCAWLASAVACLPAMSDANAARRKACRRTRERNPENHCERRPSENLGNQLSS